jgi:hypothetical protein
MRPHTDPGRHWPGGGNSRGLGQPVAIAVSRAIIWTTGGGGVDARSAAAPERVAVTIDRVSTGELRERSGVP